MSEFAENTEKESQEEALGESISAGMHKATRSSVSLSRCRGSSFASFNHLLARLTHSLTHIADSFAYFTRLIHYFTDSFTPRRQSFQKQE